MLINQTATESPKCYILEARRPFLFRAETVAAQIYAILASKERDFFKHAVINLVKIHNYDFVYFKIYIKSVNCTFK